jgi:hypothetical protein
LLIRWSYGCVGPHKSWPRLPFINLIERKCCTRWQIKWRSNTFKPFRYTKSNLSLIQHIDRPWNRTMIDIFLLFRSCNITTLLFNHMWCWLIWLPLWIIILLKRLWLPIGPIILFLLLLIRLLLLRLFVSCSKRILWLGNILLIVLIWLNYTKWTLLWTMECLNILICRLLFHNHLVFTHLIGVERLVCLARVYSLL